MRIVSGSCWVLLGYVHLCQEGRDVGGLMVGELVVLFEGGSRLCKKSTVSFMFALSFCFAFLLFRLVGWVIRWVCCYTLNHIVG